MSNLDKLNKEQLKALVEQQQAKANAEPGFFDTTRIVYRSLCSNIITFFQGNEGYLDAYGTVGRVVNKTATVAEKHVDVELSELEDKLKSI